MFNFLLLNLVLFNSFESVYSNNEIIEISTYKNLDNCNLDNYINRTEYIFNNTCDCFNDPKDLLNELNYTNILTDFNIINLKNNFFDNDLCYECNNIYFSLNYQIYNKDCDVLIFINYLIIYIIQYDYFYNCI